MSQTTKPLRVDTHPNLFRQGSTQGVLENRDKSGYKAFINARDSAKKLNDVTDRLNRLENILTNALGIPKEML